MQTKFRLIIFDLDGTLIDSAPDLADAINTTLESLGRQPFDEETIRHWVGNGARTLVGRALSGDQRIDPDLSPTLFEEALQRFLHHYAQNLCHKTKLYPGVETTLRQLRAREFQMAIATNKPHTFVHPILERLGIASYFTHILGGDSLPQKKPDPEPLLHLCRLYGTRKEQTVMVGDSKNDILAARRAPMASIGVRYGYNYGEDISVWQPDATIGRFDELLTILER